MQEIKDQLQKIIHDLYNLDFVPDLTPSPDGIDADYSTNAPLKLAKVLRQNPMVIADKLMKKIESVAWASGRLGRQEPSLSANEVGEEKVWHGSPGVAITPPGFLNFTLSDEYLVEQIDGMSKNFGKNITSSAYKNQTIICEFSDPNPFKILHVGHLYTSIVGDAISRLFEYAGATVIRANFGGDVGLHVAKTMYVLQQDTKSDLTIGDIARCYIEGTKLYDTDEHAKAAIAKLNKEIYQINSEKVHGTPLADLYWRARELSYDYFRDFYDHIGVKFDKYYPESTVAELGLAKVKEQLKDGVYEVSNGAVVFNGDKYGLHTRVFINQAGVPTYEAKDVGLIFTKWQDYHFDKSVVITGSEQKDYMAVVLKSIEQYAPELTKRSTHLTHGLVKLPGGVKMSSRKGNFLKAVDVLNMVESELKNEYGSDNPIISLAATKYAFLKYKMGGNIIFDPHESVKMTGNSGPYLLYSAVRAKKILSNCQNHSRAPQHTYNTYEKNLAKKLLFYKEVLNESVCEIAPHKVANYLYELAQEFSRFYEACPVAGSTKEAGRAKLVQVYLEVISHGLNILGINIPEEM